MRKENLGKNLSQTKSSVRLNVESDKNKLYEKLYKIALKNMDNAYAKYSGFRVSAALLDEDGNVFNGVNVENSSYGATICAERVAISTAVTDGSRKFVAIAVASSDGEVWPCGICRQVIFEFSENLDVISMDSDGKMKVLKISELLKNGFKLEKINLHPPFSLANYLTEE